METKIFLTILAVCLSAAFVLPPSANGQASNLIISADLGGEIANRPIPIVRCEEGLHLFGANNISVVKPVTGPLTLVKNVDWFSPMLRKQMTTGHVMPRMDVDFLLANPENPSQPPQRLLHVVLFDFFIPEIVLTAGGGVAVENVKFQFEKACWVGYSYKSDGSPGPSLSWCWDFKAGRYFATPSDVQ